MVPHPPMIIPDVGRGSEAQIEKTVAAYRTVARRIAELRPETSIISSPHTVMYSDYFHISPGKGARGSFADFRAGQVRGFGADQRQEAGEGRVFRADVPGQFKAFIDRCTPWCNTHEPHASIPSGKKGYVIALRTGPGMKECERIIETVNHFYGHLEIGRCGSLGLCSVERKQDAEARKDEIIEFCGRILGGKTE